MGVAVVEIKLLAALAVNLRYSRHHFTLEYKTRYEVFYTLSSHTSYISFFISSLGVSFE